MSRDLRLLPAALLGWLGCLIGIVAAPVVGGLVVATALVVTAVATSRLGRPPGGRHRGRTPGRAAATVVLTGALVALVTGWGVAHATAREALVTPYLRTSVTATIRIDGEPRAAGADRVVVAATWLTVTEADGGPGTAAMVRLPGPAVTVLAPLAWSEVVVGSRVQAGVRVAPTDPGDSSAALLVADGPMSVVARAPPVAAAVASLRAGLLAACAGLDPQAQGLVPGIALGDDRALPPSLGEDLRAVSLTHVTAVSGAHVAMVLGLVLAAAARLRRSWRAVLGAVVLVALVLLVHPGASVLRSAAMGGVLLLGLLLGRPRAALPALWTSVLVLLAIDPWLAASFGFVLSVLATAGLLLAAGPLAARFGRALPRPLAMALAVPVAAQLACLPALALLSPQLPVHGVLANVLAAPAVPPATVLGLLATLVHPVLPGLAGALAGWAGVATAWIAVVASWCASLPLAQAPWWVAVVVLSGAVLVRVLRSRLATRRARSASGPDP